MELGPEIKVDGQPAWLSNDQVIKPQWYGDHWYNDVAETQHCTHTLLTAIRLPADHFAYKAIAHGMEPWGGGDEEPADFGGEILFRSLGDFPRKASVDMRWTHKGGCGDIIGYRKAATKPEGEWYVRTSNDADAFTIGKAYRMSDRGVIDDDGCERIFFPEYYRPALSHEIPGYIPPSHIALVPDAASTPAPCPIEAQSNGEPIPGSNLMTEAEAEDLLKRYDVVGHRGVDMLRSLGMIRPKPTLLEQFEEHHGGLDNNQRDIIEAYQEWVAGL